MMEWARESLDAVNKSRLERFENPVNNLYKNLSDELMMNYHPDFVGEKKINIGWENIHHHFT